MVTWTISLKQIQKQTAIWNKHTWKRSLHGLFDRWGFRTSPPGGREAPGRCIPFFMASGALGSHFQSDLTFLSQMYLSYNLISTSQRKRRWRKGRVALACANRVELRFLEDVTNASGDINSSVGCLWIARPVFVCCATFEANFKPPKLPEADARSASSANLALTWRSKPRKH